MSKNKFYKHPAYIGYAKDKDMSNDSRQKKWKKQFKKQGFDDTCTWSLDDSIIKFILPRLKRYYEITKDIIVMNTKRSNEDTETFEEAILMIIEGFEIQQNDNNFEIDEEKVAKYLKAWELLAKWNRALWW